jgi:uncharacterized membrane protein YdjX (TVP38/TMEM64 family)
VSAATGAVSARGRRTASRLAPLVLLAVALAAFFASGLDRHLSLQELRDHRVDLGLWVARNGFGAGLAFMAAYAAAAACAFPAISVLTVAGGFLFGAALGTVYAIVGATVGATVLFLAARFAIGDLLRARVGGALARMEAGFDGSPLSYLLILRLVPVVPFWLANLAAAFLGARVATFVVATFFGIIPATVIYASVGAGAGAVLDAGGEIDLGTIFELRFLAPLLGLAALAALPILHRRLKAGRTSGRTSGRPGPG